MAQRILMQLDALDKYSHDILAKHAKKRSLDYLHMLNSLKTPFLDDFDLNYLTDEKTEGHNPLDNSHGSVRNPKANESFAFGHLEFHKTGQEEIIQQAERNTEKTKKLLQYKSRNRRPSWKSETECVPDLASLCQKENKLSVINHIGFKDIPQQQSSRTSTEHSNDPENFDLLVQRETGKQDFGQLQDKNRTDKAKYLNSEFKNVRRHLIKRNNFIQSKQDNIQNTLTITNSDIRILREKETVPLSLEDAMKKTNVKIITAGQRNEEKHVQNASETHPVIYNISHGSTYLSKWTYLHKDFQKDRSYLSSCPNKEDNCDLKEVHPVLRNNLDYTRKLLENKQNVLQSTILKKKELSLADIKQNIKFLTADGSTHFEVANDKPEFLHGGLKIEGYAEGSIVAMRPTSKTITKIDMKENPNEVGPVINGVNPSKRADKEPSSNVRAQPASKPLTASGSKPTSFSLRPKSVGEMHKWSYIAIAKPLTPPQCHPNSSPNNNFQCVAFSETTHKYTDRPDSGQKMEHAISLKPLTARSVKFESKKVRPFSVPSETYLRQPELGMKRSAEMHCVLQEIKKDNQCPESLPLTCAEDVAITNGAEPSGETTLGDTEKVSTSSTAYPIAFPIISIPTAQTDATG
ncbi:uncharacterized protein LOC108714213 [Xenopus laevis]|uniref:Uncharacterized protein LOC108714213 n=2 Tax=Xenopus laevis TaxID=8355 RepID=A0A1L8GLV7_XENLA|nr:uncharacterized protein LOC108714213 [Xenopus laevis]OCT84813.1 hypothetical protein XELAEV_18022970mg [Xenopus laevis]